ncbi:monooxygenase, partial [Pseudomonas sp. MWU13-2860]
MSSVQALPVTPVRVLGSEAEAIAVAREIATEIAAIAADSQANGQLPR